MGYEILYKFHPRLEEGGYDKNETKDLKRKLGEPFEDIPLNKLANAIMSQLARRDIWITDVEIFEYKKQKINFRETKGGIIIKNKKFALDQDANLVMQDGVVDEQTGETVQPHQIASPANNSPSIPNANKRPIKLVVVDDVGIIQDNNGNRIPVPVAIKKAGLQLSSNKRYPVFQEMDDPRDRRVDKFGQPTLDRKKVYQMWDDHQREVVVSQDYFVSAQVVLEGGRDFNMAPQPGTAPKLMYEGEIRDEIPDLRAKR